MADPCIILVVDDDPDIRDIVADILADEGYRAHEAENGKHALRILREDGLRPDLILLDMMMPELDGWGFRAEQKRDAELARIPVVVFTAHELPSNTVEQMQAAGFLKKPIRLTQLLDEVRRFCP
jgi:CheY-like chemotaxis protein